MSQNPLGHRLKDLTLVVVHDSATIDGGSSQYALSSAQGLAARGMRVILFVAVPPAQPLPPQENLTLIHTGQKDILTASPGVAALQCWWNFRAGKAMAQVLSDLDPDRTLVHVHSWSRALSASPIRQAWRLGFKVVITVHDYFWACPNGGFLNYRRNTLCEVPALSGACLREDCDKRKFSHKLWRLGRSVIEQRLGGLHRAIRHFIFCSPFSRAILQPYLPTAAGCHIVPPPVDLQRLPPVEAAGNHRLVFVGRLSREKGVHLLAQAAQRLKKEVLFVGDGPCRQEIMAIYPGAAIAGWQPRDEVLRQLRQARALVFPSTWYETFGLAAAEALALGLPVVVADNCAARDLVADGFTGLWFRRGEVADLVEKLGRLEDDRLVQAMGRRAYDDYWRRPFSLANHLDKLLAVYNEISS